MRNSDVFMRISPFLISLMKTLEKQVILVRKTMFDFFFTLDPTSTTYLSIYYSHHGSYPALIFDAVDTVQILWSRQSVNYLYYRILIDLPSTSEWIGCI